MKKLLTAFLSIILCFCCVFAFASCGCQEEDTRVKVPGTTAPELVDENGFGYIIVNSSTLTVTKYSGTATDIIVPAEYDGKPVTAIGEDAFRDCKITSVEIPSSIKSIGKRAFDGCMSLSSVKLPEGLESIGDHAFKYDTELKEIKFPSTLKSIGMYAFTFTGITTVEIPENVTTIGAYCFFQNEKLETAIVPANVTTIEKCAFAECPELTIKGESGSAIEEYAESEKIPFETIE